MANTITLPNEWEPRDYQKSVLEFLDNGGKRAVSIWHRRAGKDSCALNYTAKAAHERVGSYWHVFPEQTQARKAIWDGIDRQGRRILDQAFPIEIRKRTLDQEMKIEFKCGSFWQLIGSNNYNSLVGTNPVGVVMSEYALSDPESWEYIRPILRENEGWAWFITTPRGKNHLWKMYEMALRNESWFCEKLSVDKTNMLTEKDIQEERDSGMAESKIQQEYYCSFEEGAAAQLIPQYVIDGAVRRVSRPQGPLIMGVDPARFGDDHTVIAMRNGDRLEWILRWSSRDTMFTAARVAEILSVYEPDACFIDVVGLGAGVVDRVRQLGHNVIAANGGAKALRDTLYVNKRNEMWGVMREWLEENGDIPDNDILTSDLAMVEFEFDSRNRQVMESKKKMKERGLPSPDVGDALALTFYQPIAIRLSRQEEQHAQAHLSEEIRDPLENEI